MWELFKLFLDFEGKPPLAAGSQEGFSLGS